MLIGYILKPDKSKDLDKKAHNFPPYHIEEGEIQKCVPLSFFTLIFLKVSINAINLICR